jgi:serine/threonine protein kinase
LFELYNPFSTAMERAEVIDSLKQYQQFPTGFIKNYPVQSQIILHMMHLDPIQRPTAQEILNHPLFSPIKTIEASAETVTEVHDREMKEMQDRYAQMKNEKEDLQRRLNELQSRLDICQLQEYQSSSCTQQDKNKKRQHSLHPEEDRESHKKKELNSNYLISKILFN